MSPTLPISPKCVLTFYDPSNYLAKFLTTFANATSKNKCIYLGTELQIMHANKVQNSVHDSMPGRPLRG